MINMEMFGRSSNRGDAYRNEGLSHEKPCRTCVDFKSWTEMQQKSHSGENKSAGIHTRASDKPTREDCPLDRSQLGRQTWGLLHTIAAHYPHTPSSQDIKDVKQFFNALANIYPCEHCAKDFRKELQVDPPKTGSQDDLSQWLCRMHNNVNARLGKPLFDCSLVNERWRDGWKDGSCD